MSIKLSKLKEKCTNLYKHNNARHVVIRRDPTHILSRTMNLYEDTFGELYTPAQPLITDQYESTHLYVLNVLLNIQICITPSLESTP